jgi:hypothetical protein
MPKTYAEKDVSQWNSNDFLRYLADRHLAVYGTEYTPPGRNWQVERGLIGTIIGTKGRNAKPRKYEPEVVKAFIDRCFENHRCTAQYPTVSFTWWYKWKTDDWARVVAVEGRRKQLAEQGYERSSGEDFDEQWF